MKEIVKGILKESDNIGKKIAIMQKEQKALIESATLICKHNDICSMCIGKGDIYSAKEARSNSGDPYHRSSDDRIVCPVCNGSGRYKDN